MMTSKRIIIAYGIYLFAITAFFLYTVFPESTVREYVNSAGGHIGKGIAISVERVAPVVPLGIVFSDLRLRRSGDTLMQLDTLRATPSYLSMLSGTLAMRFTGELHGGRTTGTITGIDEQRQPVITARFRDVDLSRLPVIDMIAPKRAVTGALNGTSRISPRPGGSAQAEITAEIIDAAVDLLLPIGSIRAMAFDTITIEAQLRDNVVTIASCAWNGPLVAGRLSGTMTLQDPPGGRTIALTGSILPQQTLIKELGEPLMSRMFPEHRRRKSGYQITLSGTAEQPAFNIK